MMMIQEEPPSQPPPSPPPPPSAATSAATSPSHEFSFTISLHPSSTKPHAAGKTTKSSAATSFAAVDLSPADEIFFHGHLLPLHLLSHLPVSPRSSTNSMDSFTLPIKDQNYQNTPTQITPHDHDDHIITAAKSKPKPFSALFGRRKTCEHHHNKEKHWRKLKYEVTQAVKKYMKFVRPL